ncbi:MAG: PadR family transcriptional regulator [Roseivirga sp.]|nr:PadR family transcriptional regulator [Roseivirga sp.]
MRGTYLGELEELVLLSVAALVDSAYAVAVRAEIEGRANRKVNISAIHASLYRLEDKGFLDSHMGEATNKRGGKSKRIFTVTTYGYKTLKEAQTVRQSFWGSIPQLSAQK